MRHIQIKSFLSLSLASAAALALSGCGLGTTASDVSTYSAPATIKGNVHGGQQPVFNATVRLYASGTTGYGAGSTLLATSAASAAGTGAFSFTKLATTGGVINSALPVWQCPATGNPIIYITAVGGNTQGTTSTSVNNAASALLAVLGPCNTVNGAGFYSLNEVSTVASIFSLAQYINPGTTTPGSVTMGTAATTQAGVGILNAVSAIGNLVNIPGGNITIPPQYAGTGTAAGVTVTATAEGAKINTIANILAACINTPAATSTQCADLFSNALPPISATSTSLGTLLTAPAVDTIQAAYYMATNPASLGTAPTTCNNTGAAATTMACLYGLASSTPPFGPALTAAPSDWTLGITYTATGTCVNGNSLIAGPNKVSIDANGNIWFINATAVVAGASIVELSPGGTPLLCVGAQVAGRGLTIDPTGNVWGAFNQTTFAGAVQEIPVNTSTPVAWTTLAAPIALASDGSGNIFYSTAAAGGGFYEYAAPTTNTTPFASTNIATAFNGTASTQIGYIAADSTGRIYGVSSTLADLFVAVPTGTAGTYTQGAAALATNSYGVAIDSNNYIYTGTTCCGSAAPYRELEKITPGAGTAFTYSVSPLYTAGVNGTRAAALDGAANAWYGYELPVTVPVTGPPAVAGMYSVGEVTTSGSGTSATFTSLSPNGVAPQTCSTSAMPSGYCNTLGGFIKADFTIVPDLAIDPSGNVWVLNGGTNNTTVPTTGTTITEIVGAAVPMATPLSVAAKNGKLATKP